MKKIITILSFILLCISALHAENIIYKFEIRQDIDKSAAKKVTMAISESERLDAKYIVIEIDTYGGAVDAADKIRTSLIRTPIPTIAFINPQAASAGALISIACDSIYMSKGSSIGAATVVNQNGEVMPDKYQSFMRAMMRTTAESHGKVIINGKEVWHRDPKIAQQMCDTSNVLSFTQEEAINANYCEGKAENIEEVIDNLDIDNYVIKEQKLSTLDKIILFLMSPLLQGIFIMMIIGGIYFEIQSPGIGFALVVAIFGAVLYFAPLYLGGLAQYWEIALFVIGIGLLIVEIFVTPGFGVAGVSGIILMLTSFVFAMIDNNLFYFEGNINFAILFKPLAIVAIAGFSSVCLCIYLAHKLYPGKAFDYIALRTELKDNEGCVGVETNLSSHIGREATVVSDLHPSGKIDIDGKLYEATLTIGMAQKGEKVTIIRVEGGRLYCEKTMK
ncbi:MAG: NfeD family protein [Bacteroidales bacterium]|nr:NfeD family protein [Bacteroidales bacterium]MDD4669942.1 NfeD family protein [Bacteroidales bacterium]